MLPKLSVIKKVFQIQKRKIMQNIAHPKTKLTEPVLCSKGVEDFLTDCLHVDALRRTRDAQSTQKSHRALPQRTRHISAGAR